jgi:hypothetical protein
VSSSEAVPETMREMGFGFWWSFFEPKLVISFAVFNRQFVSCVLYLAFGTKLPPQKEAATKTRLYQRFWGALSAVSVTRNSFSKLVVVPTSLFASATALSAVRSS